MQGSLFNSPESARPWWALLAPLFCLLSHVCEDRSNATLKLPKRCSQTSSFYYGLSAQPIFYMGDTSVAATVLSALNSAST